MAIFADTYYLMVRALRETIRQPAFEFQNLFIPLFFFAVTVGAVGNVSAQAFGVDNYTGFQMPVAILQGVAGAAAVSSFTVVNDIEKGYFDKLLLTPANRLALLTGRLAADGVRVTILTAVILTVGLIFGAGMEAGVGGIIVILLLSASFGMAYGGLSIAIALRTGSAQAANAGFLLFFPLLFLSPAFAPVEVFDGWLKFLATINPVAYILVGIRSLVLEGWDWGDLGAAAAAIGGLGLFTMSLALWALRYRTS